MKPVYFNMKITSPTTTFWRGFGSVIVLRPNTKLRIINRLGPATVDTRSDIEIVGSDFSEVGADIENATSAIIEKHESKR